MRKNEIVGVKPFNGFHYKSCYYHQLISGLACFGIAKENILLNSFGEIQAGFEYNGEEYFSVDNDLVLTAKSVSEIKDCKLKLSAV